MASGGFQPVLKRDSLATDQVSFLASEHMMVKRGGVTISSAKVPAVGGRKVLEAGTFVTPITSGGEVGKYGPWSDGGSNGLGSADENESGFLLESIDVTDGDVICGIMIHGSVLSARVTADVSSAIATAVAGRILFQ